MNILRNKSFRNAGWLIAGKIVEKCIAFVVGILSLRYLGPSNYGLISYAGAYTAFFMAFCTLGINSVIVKELIDNKSSQGTVLGTAIGLKGISSFLSAIMIIAIVSVVDAGEKLTILVTALCCLGPLFNILETFNYWFQSRLQSRVTAIAAVTGYTITSAYRLYLMATGKSVAFFALATSVDYICVGVIQIIAYKLNHGEKLHFSRKYGKQLLKVSAPFILPALMVSIYGQTDRLMLKQMIDTTENGYYTTAVNLCAVWCFVLAAIIDSFAPGIMELNNTDKERFIQRNKQLYAIVFYLSLAVSCVFTLFAVPIIRILYGEEYLPAADSLRIITWYTAFSYLGIARNLWLVCMNRQKHLVWINLSAAVINVITNLLFIPLWGGPGAALASVIAQVSTIVVPFAIKPLRENSVLIFEAIALKGVFPKKEKEP